MKPVALKGIQEDKKLVTKLAIDLIKKQQECELNCITKVLNQYLGYAPTEKDFKNCIKMYRDDNESPDEFILCHRNVKLGLVTHVTSIKMGDTKFSVQFNPDIIEFEKK